MDQFSAGYKIGIANLCWNKTVVNSGKQKCLNSLVDAHKNDTMTLI